MLTCDMPRTETVWTPFGYAMSKIVGHCDAPAIVEYLPSNNPEYRWSGRCEAHASALNPDIQTRPVSDGEM